MKKGFLLFPLAAVMAYFTLSSNSTGYTANTTGSDGTTATGCGGTGCHGTSATTLVIPTIVLDSNGQGVIVTKYTPGKLYYIRLATANPTTSTLPAFGFQLSVVKGNAATNAGTFGSLAGTTTFGTGITVMTQTQPRSRATGTGGIGSTYLVSVPWTAPPAGTDSVKIYGVINLVDSNGTANASDKWNTRVATFQERKVSAVNDVANNTVISTYPNPVQSSLTLDMKNAEAGIYYIQVYDLSGRIVAKQHIEIGSNSKATIDMQQCAPGLYNVVVSKDGVSKNMAIVKQ